MIKMVTLTLTGVAQQLSDAIADPPGTQKASATDIGARDLACREIHLQADAANTHAIFLGSDNTVSASIFGAQIALPPANVPRDPIKFQAGDSGGLRPSDFWVFGTSTEKLRAVLVGV